VSAIRTVKTPSAYLTVIQNKSRQVSQWVRDGSDVVPIVPEYVTLSQRADARRRDTGISPWSSPLDGKEIAAGRRVTPRNDRGTVCLLTADWCGWGLGILDWKLPAGAAVG
jgi:hypothetical protein